MRNLITVPMVRSVCLFIAVYCGGLVPLPAAGYSRNSAAPPGSFLISVASYNAENLWDASPTNTPHTWQSFLNSLPYEQRRSYPPTLQYHDFTAGASNWYESAVLHAKVQHLLRAISLMGFPDILGLQEIESAGNTSEVFDLPYDQGQSLGDKLRELGYGYFLLGEQAADKPVAVTTAIISKLPINKLPSVTIAFETSTSNRDIQVAEVPLPSGRLLIFNSHWKSKNGGFEEIRKATARSLRQRIAEERRRDPRTDVIAIGDFNASYYESPMLELKTTGNEQDMFAAPTPYLYNLWFTRPREDRWDYSYDGSRQVLSHMLISDSLYDHLGMQYVEDSFIAVGQRGDAAKTLLNVDGRPYRWQIAQENGRSIHVGEGYSDHLALKAQFIVFPADMDPQDSLRKYSSKRPSAEEVSQVPREVNLDRFARCTAAEAQDITKRTLSNTDLTALRGKCVIIEVPSSEKALNLEVRGTYDSTYVELPADKLPSRRNKVKIGLTMTRAFDWRPNIDDSRVPATALTTLDPQFSARSPHPHSNRCYIRHVLQGHGGALRRILGKLSYQDGYLSIFAVTREAGDLLLEELPRTKQQQCLWNSQ